MFQPQSNWWPQCRESVLRILDMMKKSCESDETNGEQYFLIECLYRPGVPSGTFPGPPGLTLDLFGQRCTS